MVNKKFSVLGVDAAGAVPSARTTHAGHAAAQTAAAKHSVAAATDASVGTT
ncbi:MAG: hypothetical protein WBZ37_25595 [Mycobacterium sp.]